MAFPPAHILVGVGAAELLRSFLPLPRWPTRIACAALAVLPDFDIVLGLVGEGEASAFHGTFTHSVFAAVVVGLIAWVIAGRAWGIAASVGYASHMLVDLLDERGKTNVLLGWPFSLELAEGIARVFPTVPFQHGHGVLAAVLSLFRPEVFSRLAIQTVIGAAMCAVLLLLAAAVRRVRARRATG